MRYRLGTLAPSVFTLSLLLVFPSGGSYYYQLLKDLEKKFRHGCWYPLTQLSNWLGYKMGR